MTIQFIPLPLPRIPFPSSPKTNSWETSRFPPNQHHQCFIRNQNDADSTSTLWRCFASKPEPILGRNSSPVNLYTSFSPSSSVLLSIDHPLISPDHLFLSVCRRDSDAAKIERKRDRMEARSKVTKFRASIENFRTLKKSEVNKHGFTTKILWGPVEGKFRSVRAQPTLFSKRHQNSAFMGLRNWGIWRIRPPGTKGFWGEKRGGRRGANGFWGERRERVFLFFN